MSMKDLDECADAIEGTNSLVDWKIAFAQRVREGEIDTLLLEQVRLDAQRQVQACRRLAKIAADQN